MANNLSLVILAGGMGSRYNGQKQIDPIGPSRESLMEYSIFDAFSIGVQHFVFIINPVLIQEIYFKSKNFAGFFLKRKAL